VRFCILGGAVLACAACCATPSKFPAARYIINLGVYPDKSCIFVSAVEYASPLVKADVKPSEAFLKVACGYFLAKYQTKVPLDSNASPSAESVVWYTSNPDIPRYIPKFEM